jgi:hypothetical protein
MKDGRVCLGWSLKNYMHVAHLFHPHWHMNNFGELAAKRER